MSGWSFLVGSGLSSMITSFSSVWSKSSGSFCFGGLGWATMLLVELLIPFLGYGYGWFGWELIILLGCALLGDGSLFIFAGTSCWGLLGCCYIAIGCLGYVDGCLGYVDGCLGCADGCLGCVDGCLGYDSLVTDCLICGNYWGFDFGFYLTADVLIWGWGYLAADDFICGKGADYSTVIVWHSCSTLVIYGTVFSIFLYGVTYFFIYRFVGLL